MHVDLSLVIMFFWVKVGGGGNGYFSLLLYVFCNR
jgi:hypothetical protein